MTSEDVRALTTDSVRRSMASVGDRLQLPGERRAELGGWRDPVTEPLGKGAAPSGRPRASLLHCAVGGKCYSQARVPANFG